MNGPSTSRRSLLAASALGAATALLGGCIVVPVGRHGGYAGAPGPQADVVVEVAPPAPQYEVVGIAPGPGFFWIGGYWGWGGGRHVWYPGRWEGYRPGYGWNPHRWHRDGRGWRSAPGHWERR